ncbi:lipopolysaccharide biosynthesis protein [Elizabethkingia meningoseptica]
MLKKLFSHTLIYGLAPQVVKVAQLIVLPIVTPYLTAKDYGVFGLITAVVGAVSVFSTLGLNIVLANSFTKSPGQYKWLWRQIYGFLNLWSIIYAIVIAIIIYIFIPEEAKNHTVEIILLNVIPLVLFAPSTNIGNMYYQLSEKPIQIAVRDVLVGTFALLINLYFIKYLKMGYMGWFWAGAIIQVVFQFSYFIPLNYKLKMKPIYNFKWRTIKKQLIICLPSIPHYYSGYFLSGFDRVIMKFMGVTTASIGKYNAAQIPSNLFMTGTNAANQAIGPFLLKTYKTNDKKTELRLNFSTIIFFLVATSVLCLFLKEVLPLIIKSKGLEDIYPIAIILVMSYNYRPMYTAANNKLFYTEKTKALLKVTTAAAVISVTLNLITIYFFGYQAAAFTLFICYMYMGYSGFFIKEFKESDGTNHYPVFWFVLTIFLTGLVYFAVELRLELKICIAIFIIVIGGLGLLKVNRKYMI